MYDMPSENRTLIVGLTGGIGSGKSTVAQYFSELGVPVIDADVIAHNLVQKNTPAFAAILKKFGPQVITSTGELDRKTLGKLIFKNTEDRIWMQSLLHPLIEQEITCTLHKLTSSYGIIVIPLLVEYGKYQILDRVLVIDVPENLQIERTLKRDKVDAAYVRSVLAIQATRQQRLAIATDIIINDGDLAYLKQQVLAFHQRYALGLAAL